MADEDRRTPDPPERAFHGGDVASERVEVVLSGNHLVSFCLEDGDDLAEGRAVGPNPVDEHDARFGPCGHDGLLSGSMIREFTALSAKAILFLRCASSHITCRGAGQARCASSPCGMFSRSCRP